MARVSRGQDGGYLSWNRNSNISQGVAIKIVGVNHFSGFPE